MTTQQQGRGRAFLVIALLALAAAGAYSVVFRDSGEGDAREEHAGDRARSLPGTSGSGGRWSASEPEHDGEGRADRDRDRRERARRHAEHDRRAESEPASAAAQVMDAGMAVRIPASRRPVPPPAVVLERTEPVPADVRLRSSEALARIAEQRISELSEQLATARREGHAARAAHIERMIARIREQQPRIREHVEATRREVEPRTREPQTTEPETSEAETDRPATSQAETGPPDTSEPSAP